MEVIIHFSLTTQKQPSMVASPKIYTDKGSSVFLRRRASGQLALATYRFLSYPISLIVAIVIIMRPWDSY
jgi:hypothetical protein